MSLRLVGVSRSFAGVAAVRDVSLGVAAGEVLAVVGPNGAGKSSIVNLLSGTIRPDSGRVLLGDRDLTGSVPAAFGAAGVVRTFQSVRLFEGMDALDNVLVGAHRGARLPLVGALLRTPGFRRAERARRDRAEAALEALGMRWAARQAVGALSHGQRRRIELARAFAAQPCFLVLDEPGAGLDPETVVVIAAAVRAQADGGTGVLLVEHDRGLVERLADRVVGLVAGSVAASGSWAQVAAHPDIASQLAAAQ